MRAELDIKLCKDFPLLYRQREMSMQQTCMCWGFTHGDGWYDIIHELSTKLETLIQKEIGNTDTWNKKCFCGCSFGDHSMPVGNRCMVIHKIPFNIKGCFGFPVPKSKIKYTCKLINRKIRLYINRFLEYISPVIHKNIPCNCPNGWEELHPSASQVKEKFGTLRFYMDYGTDEMYELIHEYEEKSGNICERCGEPGECKNETGWVSTLCDKCREKKNK